MIGNDRKTILLTGCQGQVSYDFLYKSINCNIKLPQNKIIALTRQELDISDQQAVTQAIAMLQPDVVINTAAYTQVDRAEQESAKAFAVNSEGVKHLAIACEKQRCLLLHLSTDYVFDGSEGFPYKESDAVSPINVYGQSKLSGEQAIQQYCEKSIIVRISAVFGVHGINFVKTILRYAREREVLRIVSDQLTCPTPAADIAETLLKIIENPQLGLFHYCGDTVTNWFEFATQIVEKARQYEDLRVKTIEAISSAEYPTAAKRPHYSVLDCEKIQKTFTIKQPQWKIGLNHVIESLYST